MFTVKYISRVWLEQVQTSVSLDLNSARAAYNNHIEGIAQFLEAVCLDRRIASALADGDGETLDRLLEVVYSRGGMDILVVLDAEGRVCYRPRNPESRAESMQSNPIVARVTRAENSVFRGP